jgi:O-antigen ligase
MQRTGLSAYLLQKYNEEFPHPHQAYLEWLMDNGVIGFLPVLIFYFIVLKYSISLLRDKRSPVFMATGGITFSIVGTFLIASFGSQTFYPREGAVAMWCAMGLMFRVYIERSRLITTFKETLPESIDELLWKQTDRKELR